MNIIVLLKQVPDLVEELEVDQSGKELDRAWLKFILSEYDDHALEQALLLKERYGGQVKVLALDLGDLDDTLYTAVAKGADATVKITGDFEHGVDSHTAARIFQNLLGTMSYDLILTGVQAIDDLDGSAGAILATYLNLPYVGVVRGVRIEEGGQIAVVGKEYPGGMLSEMRVKLPAVLGIQAAEKPPRYVPAAFISKAMKTARLEEIPAPEISAPAGLAGLNIRRMLKPEVTGGAEMITGSIQEIVNRITGILSEKGL